MAQAGARTGTDTADGQLEACREGGPGCTNPLAAVAARTTSADPAGVNDGIGGDNPRSCGPGVPCSDQPAAPTPGAPTSPGGPTSAGSGGPGTTGHGGGTGAGLFTDRAAGLDLQRTRAAAGVERGDLTQGEQLTAAPRGPPTLASLNGGRDNPIAAELDERQREQLASLLAPGQRYTPTGGGPGPVIRDANDPDLLAQTTGTPVDRDTNPVVDLNEPPGPDADPVTIGNYRAALQAKSDAEFLRAEREAASTDQAIPSDPRRLIEAGSYLPVAGVPFAAGDSAVHAADDDWGGAGLAALGAIPGGKWLTAAGRGIAKGAREVPTLLKKIKNPFRTNTDEAVDGAAALSKKTSPGGTSSGQAPIAPQQFVHGGPLPHAKELIAKGTEWTGTGPGRAKNKLPQGLGEGPANGTLYRLDSQGKVSRYAVYDQDGNIIKRVDLDPRGRHGNIGGPHVTEYEAHGPGDTIRGLKENKQARKPTPEEFPW